MQLSLDGGDIWYCCGPWGKCSVPAGPSVWEPAAVTGEREKVSAPPALRLPAKGQAVGPQCDWDILICPKLLS